jgi:heme-degrading monooxygenase HmoA
LIVVIFEVIPAEGKVQEYLNIAARLKPLLENIDGFISIERFSSLAEEGKLLSLSFWRDEKAIEEWRNIESHRLAQVKGREGVFLDYRLRVANVSRDYGMVDREQVPSDSKLAHEKSNKRMRSD